MYIVEYKKIVLNSYTSNLYTLKKQRINIE